jgi:hypothetical protein
VSFALSLPLAAGAVALAAVALVSRRRHAGALSLAGMGVLAAALLLVGGFPGLAVAALAVTLGVAAAGLVVGGRLSEVEARVPPENPRGPWLLAFVSSALLALARGLGLLAADWPAPPGQVAMLAPGVPEPVGAGEREAAALTEWALAALAVAAALALAAFAPRPEEER